jgi:hypothetical protein
LVEPKKNKYSVTIDLPSLYGEEWYNKINVDNKINKTAEFKKHFNPRNISKLIENVSYNDIQKIKSIAFTEKNNLTDQFCNLLLNYSFNSE